MQEPESLRESNSGLNLAKFFPIGYVIEQEEEEPRRVKVRIPLYHTGIEDADLPYYRVLIPNEGNGHNGRTGRSCSLPHGSEVLMLIYDARGYNGVVMGSLPNSKQGVADGAKYSYRDDFGNSFRVDEAGKMTMTDSAGAKVSLGGGVIDIEANQFNLKVGSMQIGGEQLAMLFTQIAQTATNWSVSATTPVIVDGEGGGGGTGTAPSLTPPQLPDAPDVANKTDI